MQDIQEIFNRIQDAGRELRELKNSYKDSLNSTGEYESLKEEIQSLRDRKKSIEGAVEAQMVDHMQKMDQIARSIQTDRQMLSDIALAKLLKGEQVDLVGPREEKFDPVFSVRFVKKK